MRSSRQFTIGILARQTHVSSHTILYYERQGLLQRVRRSVGGYRLFTSECVKRICFIKQTQKLGFSLKEIKELLALQSNPRATCGDVSERIVAKIRDVDAKLRALRATRRTLLRLVAQCRGQRPLSACPILEQLGMQAVRERARPVATVRAALPQGR